MEIFLSRTTYGSLYISGYNTYQELKAAKLATPNIGWSGEPGKVKEWQAARWVRSEAGSYRNYHREEEYTGGFTKALESFNTAISIIGNPNYIIVFQK